MTARLSIVGLVVSLLVGLSSTARAEDPRDPVRAEIGKEYHIARRQLIEQGNIPLDQSHNPHQFCSGNPPVCAMYPEMVGCWVDQPYCRFEWRFKTGRRFSIITYGEDENNLVVRGMGDN
jgi:hypothetical protein